MYGLLYWIDGRLEVLSCCSYCFKLPVLFCALCKMTKYDLASMQLSLFAKRSRGINREPMGESHFNLLLAIVMSECMFKVLEALRIHSFLLFLFLAFRLKE